MTQEEAEKYIEQLKEIAHHSDDYYDFIRRINNSNMVLKYHSAVVRQGFISFNMFYNDMKRD